MTMHILKIVLYGLNDEKRIINFKPSKLNIITGASKRGKSSLLDIVDYCLGSRECNVADGHIRNTVAWYSVLLQFDDCQVFIARMAPPKLQKASTSCHMMVAKQIDTPCSEEIEASTNIKSVLEFLTRKQGIAENVTEVPEHQTRAPIRIGFKHSKFYLFQGQDEVAAKRTLFHRQAEQNIPQAIKDTLPYFMGAAEDDRLSELQKLRELKRKRAKLIKQIAEAESLKGEGLEKGHGLLAEAMSVGFYIGPAAVEETVLIEILNEVSRWVPSDPELPNSLSDEDIYYQLESDVRIISQQKKEVRSKIRKAVEYNNTVNGFKNEAKEQGLRLKSFGLYKHLTESSSCPVCDSDHVPEETTVLENVHRLNEKLEGVERSKPRLGSYIASLTEHEQILASRLRNTRNEIDAIRRQQIQISNQSRLEDKRSRIVGRISLYLESLDWTDSTEALHEKINLIDPEIVELEEKLDPGALKDLLESQLSCVSDDMTRWARELGLEHSEHPIRLDINQLTVVAETPHGRTPLYRMGSGENWVGYHLVSYLALAKWFIEQERPVASFIFFDQPTQVYFPSDKAVTGSLEEIDKDEDRQAVNKMFKWLHKTTEELSPKLQVIITDHADIDEEWFQDCVIDDKWRGDNALIPRHWYENK